jgi:hypothetical protein
VLESVKALPEDYTADNRTRAMQMSESTDPIYLGLYLKEDIPTFDRNVHQVRERLK